MLLQGNQGQTGKQIGQNLVVGLGETSEVLVSELQPRYYENNYRGQVFSATYASAALAAAAAASSFVLVNPVGSGKNLVLLDASLVVAVSTAQTTTSTDVVIGGALSGALTTVGTALTPQNCLIGAPPASVAKAYPTATLNAIPTSVRRIGAVSAQVNLALIHDDIAGAVIITPGYSAAIYSITGTAADVAIAPTLTWAEIAI